MAGNTAHSHEKFVRKLIECGAENVSSAEESNVFIVFCPIVSRFECDVQSALSSASGKHKENAQKLCLGCMISVLDANCDLCFLSAQKN